MKSNEIKQIIIVRNDLNMSRGKIAAQCCHACLESYKKAKPIIKKKWEMQGQKKVILSVNNLRELLKLKQKTEKMKIPCSLIRDAGLTELKKGTITCLGIGPDLSKKIDKITGSLPNLA